MKRKILLAALVIVFAFGLMSTIYAEKSLWQPLMVSDYIDATGDVLKTSAKPVAVAADFEKRIAALEKEVAALKKELAPPPGLCGSEAEVKERRGKEE